MYVCVQIAQVRIARNELAKLFGIELCLKERYNDLLFCFRMPCFDCQCDVLIRSYRTAPAEKAMSEIPAQDHQSYKNLIKEMGY